MVKILAIGDPHGKLPNIPRDVDLILLTGDIGKSDIWRRIAFKNIERESKGLEPIEDKEKIKKGYYEVYNSSIKILKKLSKIAPIYLVFGNIEKNNAQTKEISKEVGKKLPSLMDFIKKNKNIHLLNNVKRNFRGIRLAGIPFYGDIGWLKKFEKPEKDEEKKYRKSTEKEKRVLKWFGGHLDILICHQPPYSILDKVNFPQAPKNWQGKHAGSKVILNYIKKHQPKYVLCGHIHEGKGKKRIGKTIVYNLGVAGKQILDL
ncbi:MAG: metallophosphoesterase family protein [Candidatus Nanoarchaeia archaeon]